MKLRAIRYWLSGWQRCVYCHEWTPSRDVYCMFTGGTKVKSMLLCIECLDELAVKFRRMGMGEVA